MKKGIACSVLVASLLGSTTVMTPLMTIPAYAQESRIIEPTNQYSTDMITVVDNGTGAIDASSDLSNYVNLDDFTINGTFSLGSNSDGGVNSIFFIGDNTTANNYFTLYVIPSAKKLGVELRNASGGQMLSNSNVTLSEIDFTLEHKVTFTMSGNNYYRIYLDGKKVLEGNVSSGFTNGVITNPNYMGFGIGSRSTGQNNYPMTGNLKDLELYNSAIDENQIISYHLGKLESVIYEHSSVYYKDANVDRVQDNDNLDKLVAMTKGSISIRYRVNDSNSGRMSLFSISNRDTSNKYIDLYVDPSQDVFGLNIEGTKDFVMPTSSISRANRTVKDTAWHTITITKDNGSGKGFMFYLDGVYIDKYTTAVQEGFFNILEDANAVNLGFIDTSGNDLEALSGVVDYIKAYDEILDTSAISQEHTLTTWQPGQEIDMTNVIKTETENLFYQGYDDSGYRIPSLLKTSKGTLLAAIDKRQTGAQDYGNIDISLRRREANQDTFGDPIIVTDLISNQNNPSSSAFLIDSSMLEDKETGRVYLLVDMFPESSGLMDSSQLTTGTGYTKINGVDYLQLFDTDGNQYTVRPENGLGYVYDDQNNKTEYTVILENDAPYHERGSLYLNGDYKGNIYMLKDSPDKGELHVLNTQYLWLTYSDDDGKTWANPVDITPQVKQDWMMFLGTGPGVGLQLKDGKLAFPVYSASSNVGGSQSSAMIISADDGKTWTLGKSPQENMGNDRETMNNSGQMFTESQAVQLNNGQVKLFMRNTYANKVYVATSSDGGFTWDRVDRTDINEVYCQLSVVNYTHDGKEYVVMTNPDHSPRTQGMVHIGEVDQTTGDITWTNSQILNTGKFQYSCLSVLENNEDDVRFGLLYEDDTDGTFKLRYTEFNDDFIRAGTKTEQMKNPEFVSLSTSVNDGKLNISLKFNQDLLVAGNPQLKLDVGNQIIFADYLSGSGSDTIVFEVNLPASINGIMKAIEIIETDGVIENIKNGKVEALNTTIYDFTKIVSGITLDSYTSQHSTSTAENTDGAASNVIDDNPNTYWHSVWGDANINLPQSVTLKLDETKQIYKFAYTPRQNSNSGRIKQYEISVSTDGQEFTSVASGIWQDTNQIQYVEFVPIDAKYIKLTAYEAYAGGAKQSCAVAGIDLYEYSDGVIESGNKTRLTNLVNEINSLDKNNYSKVTVDNLNVSINEAQILLSASIVSQNMLDNAYLNLSKAKKSLVDITKAKDVLIKLNNLNDKDYTVESWAVFVTELTALNEKLDTTVSAREVLDIIVKADYIESQLKPNKDLLQDLISKANGLNRASYTAASLKVVDVEVEKATAVLNNPEATKEEVEAVVAALTKAMSGLEIKPNNPSVDTNTPVKPGDTTASVKTGDDSNLVSALGAVTSLSVIAYLSRKKKK
ncbi:Sialidase, N-terminal domain [Thomasclavelia cocleata]|uniref:exo-alpha-sialidase n=5 Tax=Thomasclavelia cocleata TaxID=69824 RepID=A0A1I0CLN7_9FIRM|nr:discoidin domain-containing protein [Thomasclavelia cocleata]MCR1959472.1 exo-alpha-sialidase [Thomasclavelia cocleata]NDO42494.1 LPXTG cell wall anchor domain-containing protein [Thomasclavelia cocleata]SET20541.1 Sialidase, N-terminal domain [Thomasclavelia cocleata]